jgi:hypothetical protein
MSARPHAGDEDGGWSHGQRSPVVVGWQRRASANTTLAGAIAEVMREMRESLFAGT